MTCYRTTDSRLLHVAGPLLLQFLGASLYTMGGFMLLLLAIIGVVIVVVFWDYLFCNCDTCPETSCGWLPESWLVLADVDVSLGCHLSIIYKTIKIEKSLNEYRYENNSLVLKDTTESFRIQDRYGNNGMRIGLGDSTGVLAPSGDEISLGGKKLRESDIGGGTIAGKAIITWDGGMTSYACIYGSSCKGGNNSMSNRYLVKSSEELGEMFPGEAGK
ncbi:hypothetical protein Tco_0216498 [Tanacetum coccineum]